MCLETIVPGPLVPRSSLEGRHVSESDGERTRQRICHTLFYVLAPQQAFICYLSSAEARVLLPRKIRLISVSSGK